MQNQDGKKRKHIIIVILIIAVLVLSAIVAVASYQAGYAKNSSNSKGIVIDEDASEWDKDLGNISGNQKGIEIPGYGEITVQAGDTTWNITLANPKNNDCYFQYTITVDDSETPIYESDYIEPGKAITEFEVSKPLEAGEYSIYMNISTYSMDGKNTRLNGASVKADLHVVP